MAKKAVNTYTKGLSQISNQVAQVKDSYSYALNAVKENIINNPESITNEKGFKLHLDLGYDYILLNATYLGKKEYALFIMNKEGDTPFNKVILIDNDKLKSTVIDNINLNFDSSYPIISTYRTSSQNERLVYFVDGLNEDRVINIDIDNNSIDISLLSIDLVVSKPTLDVTSIDNGGNILSGQYFIAISYNLSSTLTTSPIIISNGLSISSENYYNNEILTESNNKLFGLTDGDIINTPTKKALKIEIDQIDPNFNSYNIIVCRKTETSLIINIVKNISSNTNSFIYTGNEGELDDSITLNDLIIDTIKYSSSEAITQKDNRLLRANTKLNTTNINYQKLANQIVVNYLIVPTLVYDIKDVVNAYVSSSITDPNFYDVVKEAVKNHSISPSYLANTASTSADNKTLMRDEVYSLGLNFELTDGLETDIFHIPGRPINMTSNGYNLPNGIGEYNRYNTEGITNNWDDVTYDSKPLWRTKNTALNNGQLGYWRSSISYEDGYDYPTDGEKNGSGKSYIRHHKMPSDILEPIYETEIIGDPNRAGGESTKYKIYKRNLALTFSNIIIPDDLKGKIKKINFFYTPRNSSNKSILSKGLLYGTHVNSDSEVEQSFGFNFNQNKTELEKTFEFISPEVNFNFKKQSLQGDKIKVCGIDKGYVNYVGGFSPAPNMQPYIIDSFSNGIKDSTGRLTSTIAGLCFYNQRTIPKEHNYSKNIDKSFFVDNNFKGNTVDTSINFKDGQDSAIIKLLEPLSFLPIPLISIQSYYPELQLNQNESSVLYPNYSSYKITDSGLNIIKTSNTIYDNFIKEYKKLNISKNVYYDLSYYVSIVSTKDSQYGNIKDLQFTKFNNNFIYNNEDNISFTVTGGDTFIDVHHFKKTRSVDASDEGELRAYALNLKGSYNRNTVGQEGNLITKIREKIIVSLGSFFCETDLNIRMRREDNSGNKDSNNYFPKSYFNALDYDTFYGKALFKEYYNIDDFYNTSYLKLYFANNKTIVENLVANIRYVTRIVYSDKQNYEDKIDNYRKTRANNYKDLPSSTGGISILFISQDKLYAITRDSLFNVFTSNQNLQTLNETTISIGTGEFLGTEPIELISIKGGYAGTSSKLSFVESPYGYLFIDRYKGKIIIFDGKLTDIAIKDISEFIEENYNIKLIEQLDLKSNSDFDNPLNNYGYICGYDDELNRLLITKLDFKLINDLNYKGIFNPDTSYEEGDIYFKDGKFLYKYVSKTDILTELVNTSNLNDFIIGAKEDLIFTSTDPTNGVIVTDNILKTITYTPNLDYIGEDSFIISSNCKNELVEIEVLLITYDNRWVVDPTTIYCLKDELDENTGLQGYSKLLKVVAGGDKDGQPLDINNNLVTFSGLPQTSVDNVDTDPNYIPPILDMSSCPVPVQIATLNKEITTPDPQIGGFNEYGSKFTITSVLEEDLLIYYSISYINTSNIPITISSLFLTLVQGTLSIESDNYIVTDGNPAGTATIDIIMISPNPNGDFNINY